MKNKEVSVRLWFLSTVRIVTIAIGGAFVTELLKEEQNAIFLAMTCTGFGIGITVMVFRYNEVKLGSHKQIK